MYYYLPLVKFHLRHGDTIRNEGLHGFRVSLEQLEEGHDTHGLQVVVEDGPALFQVAFLLGS